MRQKKLQLEREELAREQADLERKAEEERRLMEERLKTHRLTQIHVNLLTLIFHVLDDDDSGLITVQEIEQFGLDPSEAAAAAAEASTASPAYESESGQDEDDEFAEFEEDLLRRAKAPTGYNINSQAQLHILAPLQRAIDRGAPFHLNEGVSSSPNLMKHVKLIFSLTRTHGSKFGELL